MHGLCNELLQRPTRHAALGTIFSPWRSHNSTQRPNDPATQQPSDPATQQPSNPATQRPSDRATEQPSNRATQQPSNPATQQPSDPATQQPSNRPSTSSKSFSRASPQQAHIAFLSSPMGIFASTSLMAGSNNKRNETNQI